MEENNKEQSKDHASIEHTATTSNGESGSSDPERPETIYAGTRSKPGPKKMNMGEPDMLSVPELIKEYSLSHTELLRIIINLDYEIIDGKRKYNLSDILTEYSAVKEQMEAKRISLDQQMFMRVLPQLKEAVEEAVNNRLRKYYEADRINSMLGEMKGLIEENKATVKFITRLTGQLDLAAAAGVYATMPTAGMKSSVSTAVSGGFPGGAIDSIAEVEHVISKAKDSTTRSTGKGKNTRLNTQTTNSGASKKSKKKTAVSQQVLVDESSSNSDELRDIVRALLAGSDSFSQARKDRIERNMEIIEEIAGANIDSLSVVFTERGEAINDIIAGWKTDVSDVPVIDGDFFSNLTEISEWAETKVDTVPPLVQWLVISRQTENNEGLALVEAADFLYTTRQLE